MLKNLTLIQKGNNHYIDSREVAVVIGKEHNHLLRDIRSYARIIDKRGASKNGHSDFFVESSYSSVQNKVMPCYLISRMGADIIANKLSGEKGILFTVAYVTRFTEMEAYLRAEREKELLAKPSLSDCNETAKIVVSQLKAMGVSTNKIIEFLNNVYEPLGLTVADEDELNDIPHTFTATQLAKELGIYSLYGRPHAQAVSCILNENIFISDKHKISVSSNYENGIAGGFRYDECALEKVSNWLAEYGNPSEIYGFYRIYHVLYSS